MRGHSLTHRQTRMVTLRDIARYCGVSLSAASCAMRGESRHVSPDTVARIRAAGRELGYDRARSHAARRLRYSADASKAPINRLIALSFGLEQMDSPYFTSICRGIGEVAQEQGFCILTDWTLGKDPSPSSAPAVFRRGEVDGIIIIEGQGLDSTIAALRILPGFGARPIVALFKTVPDCSAVLADDRRGGYLLANHLLSVGHRRIAYLVIGGWPHEQRSLGFADAAREAGLDPASCLVPVRVNATDASAIDEALRTLTSGPRAVSALLAGNDHLAMRMAAGCARLGLRIPDDLALAGYDDTHVLPGGPDGNLLTTVRIPLLEAGRRAAAALIDHVTHPGKPPSNVVLPVELVVRGSTALPARIPSE